MPGIGTCFRIEWRHHRPHLSTQATDHVRDHVVRSDQDAVRLDAGGEMAVAEMPGEPHQSLRLGGGDGEQRLWRGDHPDHTTRASTRQFEPISVTEMRSMRKIEHELPAALGPHEQATAMPTVIVGDDGIDLASAVPVSGAQDGTDAAQNKK